MTLVNFFKSKIIFIGLITVVVVFIIAFPMIKNHYKLPEGSVRKINRAWENPPKFDPLKIGGKMPGGPGDWTFAPHLTIPASQKFYVNVAEPDTWCSTDDCGLDGDLIQTMGGWLQVEHIYGQTEDIYGLDLPENRHIKSVVIVGDRNGRIVGMFPNKGLKDVLPILKLYPKLANFNFLNGVNEFGFLKVGQAAPLKPGDTIESDELKRFSVTKIPKSKIFYVYAIEKRKYDMVGIKEKYENKYACISEIGCRYPEPDPPHDFLFDDVDRLGGWFLVSDEGNLDMIKLFGLNPQEVLSGKNSLVVLTDSNGIIVALHPQKTMSDAITILSQHPELVDVQKKLYGE